MLVITVAQQFVEEMAVCMSLLSILSQIIIRGTKAPIAPTPLSIRQSSLYHHILTPQLYLNYLSSQSTGDIINMDIFSG